MRKDLLSTSEDLEIPNGGKSDTCSQRVYTNCTEKGETLGIGLFMDDVHPQSLLYLYFGLFYLKWGQLW